MSSADECDDLVSFRRDLHRHPEPAWCEFYTTSRIVEALDARDVDELYVGPAAIDGDARRNVPDDDTLQTWLDRARAAGADPSVLETVSGGLTGAVAVLDRGDGPTIGLRVDIDALPITEAREDHVPADEGFRSEHEGYMHACGHDAHTTIGLGVLDAVADSDFAGTLKVFFQPAEEKGSGAEPMAKSGHVDDVDYLLAVHVGFDHPTGEVVAGFDGFLAVRDFQAAFVGEPAHAGANPHQGRNAIQALGTAIENLYAIPRHGDGPTRVNVGVVDGGTATNVVPEAAVLSGQVRGETTELMEYTYAEAERVLRSAATLHDVELEIPQDVGASAPSAESDDEVAAVVAAVAGDVDGVTTVLDRAVLDGSEDATHLMRRVTHNGGRAAYVGVGTDHPGGHHTETFDVDEESLRIGVEVISGAVTDLAERRP
ncbi:amidohydrolase [Halovivax cerinus]|uniref:Amidohydrolase n=1 Tax=Halovivax cerinus TaxID=1487865 RepID=A0ABD5NPP5_9EURY|nr:amidohydrolase [Halovivax cerinus]